MFARVAVITAVQQPVHTCTALAVRYSMLELATLAVSTNLKSGSPKNKVARKMDERAPNHLKDQRQIQTSEVKHHPQTHSEFSSRSGWHLDLEVSSNLWEAKQPGNQKKPKAPSRTLEQIWRHAHVVTV